MEVTKDKIDEFVARLSRERSSVELINAARSRGFADALRLTYPQFLEVGKAWDSEPGKSNPEIIYNLCRTFDDKSENFSVKVERIEEGKGLEGTFSIGVVTIAPTNALLNLSEESRKSYMWKWWEGFILVFGTARKAMMPF